MRLELGYGDKEFAVNNESVILYDMDETQNLPNKLRDLGITEDTSLIVVDEDDEDPYVNVRINIQEAKESLEDKPIKADFSAKPEIPRRPKEAAAEANGVAVNGSHAPETHGAAVSRGVKRPRDDETSRNPKKAKTVAMDEVIVVDDDDPSEGQIIIDDD